MKTAEIKMINIAEIGELEELKGFLPQLDEIADERLWADIKEHGIREPVMLAEYYGKNIILDGHNRIRIARQLNYSTVPAVFRTINDLTEARQIMLFNQLAKRNLSVMERVKIVLELEPGLTAAAKARKKMTKKEKVENSLPSNGKVIQQLAKLAGKSDNTIRKVKAILRDGSPETIAATDRDVSIDTAFRIVSAFPKQFDRQKVALADAIINKKPVIERPENNRYFTYEMIQVIDNEFIIDQDKQFFTDRFFVKAEDEAARIEEINAASEYYKKLYLQFKRVARMYKTDGQPESDKNVKLLNKQ